MQATLSDGDLPELATAEVIWEWTVSRGDPEATATSDSYTPEDGDVRKTLRVMGTYEQDGEDKTVGPVPVGTVHLAPVPINVGPVFSPETANRKVAENARSTRLGVAVRATDANDSTLTYTVSDPANFSVSPSGQLSTVAMLNHEGTGNDEREVTVTATDPWGLRATLIYTVTVDDVNEAPTIDTGPTRRDHAENTPIETTIATYVVSDIDADDTAGALTWSLEGEDAAKFSIVESTGVLTFEEPPNYEKPTDRNKDNVYKVTVVVSDDGSPKLTDERQVEVTVTDMDEAGVVTLSTVAPKEGIALTASLKDSDGGETDVTWQWWKSVADEANEAPDFLGSDGNPDTDAWMKIDDTESDTYEPVMDDIGDWLTARASYADRRGTGKTAHKSSDDVVIINHDNRAPVFKENEEEITEATRKVAEDAEPNEGGTEPESIQGNVGDLVMATDPNDDDLLTYTLGGPDAHLFKITDDITTTMRGGQISLKTADTLDYEDKKTHMVTVTAADPNGLSDSVDVTIKVTDVDEAPKIKVGGLAISAGPTNPDHPENSTADVGTYTVVGSMKDSASWTLTGNDASHFMVQPATGMSVTLMFKSTPDYEMPMDADMDNVYEVSVEATDSESNTAMRAVTITVTNEEETGEVTLWAGTDALTMAPQVGDTITGAVMDPDGGVTVESWQWSRTMTPDMMDSWMPITGATDAAYMVAAGDVGYYLRVMATYTDAAGTDMAMEHSPATMMVTMMVTMNAAPMFDSETGTREVAENTAAGDPVGAPVTAMDADAGDTLTYSLSGTDAASFDIDSGTGQITVGAGTMLDFEANQITYMVTVTATDAAGATDSIDVTVTVTDVDEGMPMDLLTRYDDDDDGWIQLTEARDAVGDYFIPPKGTELTLADARKVIGLYFDYKNRSQ